MKAKATTWLAQIAAVPVMLALVMAGSASASSGLLSENSCRGKNSLEGGFHRASASVSGETCRGWGDFCHEEAADSVVAPQSTVRVFRVEGTPNARIAIGEAGEVAIADGDKTLFLNFGSKARAEQYLAQKLAKGLPGAEVKSFEVPKSFVDELRAAAVDENLGRALPGRPIKVDVTKAPDQFGLRPEQIEALKKAIIQGSGKTGLP